MTPDDLSGSLFGIAAAPWTEGMPLFLGLATPGPDHAFVVSRAPFRDAGGRTCLAGTGECDDQGSTMLVAQGLEPDDWHGAPVTNVGWFRVGVPQAARWVISVDPTDAVGLNPELLTYPCAFVTVGTPATA